MATQAPPNSKPNRQYGAEVIWPSRPMERRPNVGPLPRCRECRGPIIDATPRHEDYCRFHPVNCQVDPAELRERERKQNEDYLEGKGRQDQQMTMLVKPTGCSHNAFRHPIDAYPPVFTKYISARCPECDPSEFPQLCKIVKDE